LGVVVQASTKKIAPPRGFPELASEVEGN